MTSPLVAIDLDVRDMPYMPLDVVRLRDSDLATLATGDEFRAAVLLWCASWHQVPAASLPDDDRLLAAYAGYGRDVKGWIAIREGALRGFVGCDDGRLYHPVIADKAIEADAKRKRQRVRTANATEALRRKRGERNEDRNDNRDDECNEVRSVDRSVARDDVDKTIVTISKGREEKVREEKEVEIANAISRGHADDLDPPASLKREKFTGHGEVTDAIEAWNALATDCGLPKAQVLTAERKANITARLKDCGGIEGWNLALAKIRDAPHLLGQNDRGWRVDLDFVLRKSKFVKLMEGGYEGRTPTHSKLPSISERFARIRDEIDATGSGEEGHDSSGENPSVLPRLRQSA